jgi:hypothetical protein
VNSRDVNDINNVVLNKTSNVVVAEVNVFRIETTGEEKKKARWVVDRSKQIKGVDYDKAFAQTPSMQSFFAIMAIRMERGMDTIHIDWAGEHLHAIQDVETYVRQPIRFKEKGKEHWVRKLIHTVYGKCHAAYRWELVRDPCLIEDCRFERSPYDPCTFGKRIGKFMILIDVHADDAPFLFDPEVRDEVMKIIKKIESKFGIIFPTRLRKHLGMRIDYGDEWTLLDQVAYLTSVIETFQENLMEKKIDPLGPRNG